MSVCTNTLRNYPYVDPTLCEAAERMPRLKKFIDSTALIPTKFSRAHSKLLDRVDHDHGTGWKLGRAPFVMIELYRQPDAHQLGRSGNAFLLVPQQHSIYRPDTYMVIMTSKIHAPLLDQVATRLGLE